MQIFFSDAHKTHKLINLLSFLIFFRRLEEVLKNISMGANKLKHKVHPIKKGISDFRRVSNSSLRSTGTRNDNTQRRKNEQANVQEFHQIERERRETEK